MAVVLLVACQPPHGPLAPLPPMATPGQRVQAYADLHAVSEKTTWQTTCGGRGGCSTRVQRTLRLTNGTQVHYPEDLLPVLAPDSAAARAVHASLGAKRKSRNYALLALAGVAAFAFVAVSSLPAPEDEFSTTAKVGLLTTGAVTLVTAFASWHYYFQSAALFGDANELYNDGLAEQLNLCADGLRIVPCETMPAPGTAPLQPPSATLPVR